MIAILTSSLLPIFVVTALGYFAGWVRDIDNRHVGELNALVMDFALPASLFVATASASGAVLVTLWPLILVLVVSMLLLYAVSFWMQRRLFGLEASAASVQTLTVALPNYVAGLPLIAAVFGGSKTIYVALAIAVGSIFLSPVTLAILEVTTTTRKDRAGGALILHAMGRSLLKPIVLAPLVGMAFSLLGIPLPEVVRQSLQLIGQAAGGVALFLTGLILSSQQLVLSLNVISGTLLKNLVHPLLVVLLIMVLPMDNDTARAAILLTVLPSGFFGVLFGLRYGVQSPEAGSTLIASSLLGIVTLSIALILTSGG